MSEKKEFYEVFNYGDQLFPGLKLKIEHSISATMKVDISELVSLPLAEIERRHADSVVFEKAIFDQILGVVGKWEDQAALTMLLDDAIEYIKTPTCKHSSNQWEIDEYGYHSISNMTYKMEWHVYEHTRYDYEKQTSIPVSWDLTWSIYPNSPETKNYRAGRIKIAGQDKKTFTDKAVMEKYLQGRIKAHSGLFAEISPPIPSEYEFLFKVNALLLPGYTVAGGELKQPEQAKQSVLALIAESRTKQRKAKDTRQETPVPDKKKSKAPAL